MRWMTARIVRAKRTPIARHDLYPLHIPEEKYPMLHDLCPTLPVMFMRIRVALRRRLRIPDYRRAHGVNRVGRRLMHRLPMLLGWHLLRGRHVPHDGGLRDGCGMAGRMRDGIAGRWDGWIARHPGCGVMCARGRFGMIGSVAHRSVSHRRTRRRVAGCSIVVYGPECVQLLNMRRSDAGIEIPDDGMVYGQLTMLYAGGAGPRGLPDGNGMNGSMGKPFHTCRGRTSQVSGPAATAPTDIIYDCDIIDHAGIVHVHIIVIDIYAGDMLPGAKAPIIVGRSIGAK